MVPRKKSDAPGAPAAPPKPRKFFDLLVGLGFWLVEKNIPRDDITIVIRVKTRETALRLHHYMREELPADLVRSQDNEPSLCGVRYAIESPLDG